MLQKFDLIVIGGGTGLDVASAVASRGFKVALVEKDMLGGTCLNRGCIPSKLLIHSADVVQLIKKSKVFGINTSNLAINFEQIVNRINDITDNDSKKIKVGLLKSENPTLYTQECYFVGKKKLAFRTKQKSINTKGKETVARDSNLSSSNDGKNIITADKILIVTGTVPFIPKIKGLEKSGFITSDEAFRLKKQPQTITFIGGGYIACELAHFFGSLGSKVNIIQRNNLLIPNEDEEVSQKFTQIFCKKYKVYLGYNAESVSRVHSHNDKNNNNNDNNSTKNNNNKDNYGKFMVVARHRDSGKIIEVESDQLIVCTGRKPNLSILDLEKTGVEVNENGFIKVDEYLQTTMPGIFALGDVVGRYQFKHNANLEAQYVFHNLLLESGQNDSDDEEHDNKKKLMKKKLMIKVDYTAMPHAIFSSPQVAGVGFTEQKLNQKKIKYKKSVYPYIETGMGLAIDDKDGFVKFLVDNTNRKILGCHILGTDASTLIHEVLVSMRTGNGTIDDISNTVHIHPALSEVVGRAASKIDN